MECILRRLPAGSRVLDLAAQHGSYDPERYQATTVRVDLDAPVATERARAVRASAEALPFPGSIFDAVICNHGLEHFAGLRESVREMGRVLKPGGALFVAVPDAGTLADQLYRFMASGGGHVNAFRSAEEVVRLIRDEAGLEPRGRQTLFASLSFLHPANRGSRRNRRLWLLLGAGERTLRWATWLLRMIDRRLRTRLSVYGWAFYFGELAEAPDTRPWVNVCIRCGSGHPAERLEVLPALPRIYLCPYCGTRNLFVGPKKATC